ncbi:MAG: DUF6599 family protein [Blastocatellia bacterium]
MKYQNLFILCCIVFLSFVFALPVPGADAAASDQVSFSNTLPDKIGNGWKAIAALQKKSVESFPATAATKLLLEYGLQAAATRQYTNGQDKLTLDVFEMKYPSGAYGLWTFHRQSLPTGQKEFFAGRYVVRISASDGATVDAISTELQNRFPPAKADTPLLPTYLPEQNKIADSEKYLIGPEALAQLPALINLKEAIDFTGGTHAATAEYNHGGGKMSIILVEFQSPQFATDGLAKIQQHFNALSPEERKKRLVRRVGNYAVEAVNVVDTKAAEELLGQIKYMARVHWEGKGLSAIPLQFRPPDPVSLQEAVQTGQFIVAAFYWIGILVLGTIFTGIFAGGGYFYWRRAQRRKWGQDDLFSDAGGMTRLNLEDYLLTEPRNARKLLGKKE